MNRVRRNPFGAIVSDVTAVQDEFARLFNRVAPHVTGQPAGFVLDVWEDESAFHVAAELPGVDPAKLDVTVVEGNHLTISGERVGVEAEASRWLRRERPAGAFARSVVLPALVDADKVEAKSEFGVLRLTLPKHETTKPRKISVK